MHFYSGRVAGTWARPAAAFHAVGDPCLHYYLGVVGGYVGSARRYLTLPLGRGSNGTPEIHFLDF